MAIQKKPTKTVIINHAQFEVIGTEVGRAKTAVMGMTEKIGIDFEIAQKIRHRLNKRAFKKNKRKQRKQ